MRPAELTSLARRVGVRGDVALPVVEQLEIFGPGAYGYEASMG